MLQNQSTARVILISAFHKQKSDSLFNAYHYMLRDKKRERERETLTHDTDTWFIVKATDPYTRLELGGGRWGRG